MLVCTGIIGSTGSTNLLAQIRQNGTFLTSGTYYYHTKALTTSSTAYAAEVAQGATSYLLMPAGGIATGINDGIDLVVHLIKCNGNGSKSIFTQSAKATDVGKGGGMFGNINNHTGNVDGIKFFASSGNLTGTFKIYGLAKS